MPKSIQNYVAKIPSRIQCDIHDELMNRDINPKLDSLINLAQVIPDLHFENDISKKYFD